MLFRFQRMGEIPVEKTEQPKPHQQMAHSGLQTGLYREVPQDSSQYQSEYFIHSSFLGIGLLSYKKFVLLYLKFKKSILKTCFYYFLSLLFYTLNSIKHLQIFDFIKIFIAMLHAIFF